MGGLSKRGVLDHWLRTGYINQRQYDRAVAKLEATETPPARAVPPPAQPPSFLDPSALPLISPDPKPKSAEQIAEERAAMNPAELIDDFLREYGDPQPTLPPVFTPTK